jgi:N utilization substance protein A
MKSDFLIAVTQLAAERGLPKESVVSAVEAALASAYKKDSTTAGHDITVKLDPSEGEVQVFIQRTVVDTVEDSQRQISLTEAAELSPDVALGAILETEVFFPAAGRIAAQTAKQVVLQRLREAERELVLAEYTNRVGDLIAGRIERVEPHHVVVNLGRVEGIMPKEEQVSIERYRPNQTLQFYLLQVASTTRGPEIILSRSHRELLRRLFEREVPEIFNGIVELQSIAREPGSRSKVAVSTRQAGVDPVGSCVGLRGFRIQNIVNELQGENIDVIQWDSNQSTFLSSALSPAQVLKVELDEVNKAARMVVNDRQLSLAIGREGQNVRLAAKLTGWKIDLMGLTEFEGGTEPSRNNDAEVSAAIAVVEPDPPEQNTQVGTVSVVAESEASLDSVNDNRVQTVTPAEVTPEAVALDISPSVKEISTLSAEEELLAAEQRSEENQPREEPSSPESPELPIDSARFWGLPTERKPSVLRFAEDIMPGRGRGREQPDQERGRRTSPRRNRPSTEENADGTPESTDP